MKLAEKIKCDVEKAGIPANGLLIAALSGGADSMALTEALIEGGYSVVAVHCNYHLRGEESDRDAAHVEEYCKKKGIRLIKTDFDVDCRKSLTGESTEMACRELRYQLFEQVKNETGASAIAVGHHREDNIETFFINLLRGSGLTGLAGMKSFDKERKILRPMLRITRSEIEDYLNEKGIKWVNDSTNAISDVKRNRLRNEILPLMRDHFPDADDRISASIGFLRDNLSLYNDMASKLRRTYSDPEGTVDIESVIKENTTGEAPVEMIIYEILRPSGFNISQCKDLASGTVSTGSRFSTPLGEFIYDRGKLRRSISGESKGDMIITEITGEPFSIPFNNPAVIYLSCSVLSDGHTLRLRQWRHGDRIKPFGMKGSKLVSDLLTDAKIALDKKRDIQILVRIDDKGCEKEILWVCGIRASCHFPVAPDSLKYLKIEYKKS